MSKRDYYEILGVDKKATKEEIKKAYRKKAIKLHPDKNPDDKEAEEAFKECAEAYEILSDDEKRSRYDRFGHQPMGGGFSYMDPFEMFRKHFEGGFGERSKPRQHKGQDCRVNMKFTLEELFKGTKRTIEYTRNDKCEKCDGSGGSGKKICPTCGGSGRVIEVQQLGNMVMQQTRPCMDCNGTGEVITKPCKACDGSGLKNIKEVVEIEIPAGSYEGMIIMVGGKGHAIKDGITGDLQIRILEKPHDYYEKKGIDLKYYLDLTYPEIVLGCEKEIPTIEGGKVKIKIKELSQPNTILRLKDKGMKKIETNQRGDLHIQLGVEIPDKISGEERKILEELKKLKK
jgi:molecular chaperone DnaJ